MNTAIFKIMALLLVAVATVGGGEVTTADNPATVNTERDNIRFSVSYSKSCADNVGILVKNAITNNSGQDIRMVRADPIRDKRIFLSGPDGRRIAPYPYLTGYGRFVNCILAPGKDDEESICLDDYFPFETPGEYRCLITRRIYLNPHTSTHFVGPVQGDPFDITAQEIRFRVAEVKDVKRRSRDAAGMGVVGDALDGISFKYATAEPATGARSPVRAAKATKAAQPAASRWWWVMLAIPALVLLWLGARSKRPR